MQHFGHKKRDIQNQIVYARDKGREEGREETLLLIEEQLRKKGMSEAEIQRILADARK